MAGVKTHGRASLQDGWNLIGISEAISVQDFINASCATKIKDFVYFYEKDNDSNTLSALKAGKAYFINIP